VVIVVLLVGWRCGGSLHAQDKEVNQQDKKIKLR